MGTITQVTCDTSNIGQSATCSRTVTVREITPDCGVVNQNGKPAVTGEGVTLAPRGKITGEMPDLPAVTMGD